MAQIYNLKILYRYGGVSSVNTELCKTEKIDKGRWLYKFEDALVLPPLRKFDWDEPVLEVEEHKNTAGEVTHLIFTIVAWDGIEPGVIVWGTNEFPVWQEGELEYPLSLNTGKQKAISIKQILTPTITKAPSPSWSWWDKLTLFSKGIVLGGGLLMLGLIIWKIKKRGE